MIIASVPIMYGVTAYLSALLAKRAHQQSDVLRKALKYMTNAIRNIETVKCFNGERYELQRYANVVTWAGSLYNKQANFRALQLGAMQFFTLSVFFQGFWYGSYQIFEGRLSTNEVITTFWAAMMAVQGVTAFLPQYIVLQKGKVAGVRLRALVAQLSGATATLETLGHLVPADCEGSIEFQNVSAVCNNDETGRLMEQVSFSYPSRLEQPALHNVSVSFPSGETSFVIGRSGSGKSTLGQLLIRFYQPTSGQIWFDGNPLQDLDVHWLRRQITLVEQHSVLFNDSIRRNIALGQPDEDVNTTDILSAVSFAMLERMIEDLPDGLDTELSMQGNSVSGGQLQRLALARARLRDSPILILDESTSALDYITRSAILQSIRSWRQGRTTIIITHDISQIMPDDFVYIMDQAEVVQQGIRRAIEVVPNSPFLNFIRDTEEAEKIEEDVEDDTEDDDTEDEIGNYENSRGGSRTSSRQTSAAFRRSGMFSPFISPDIPDTLSKSSRIADDDAADVTKAFAVKIPPRPLVVFDKPERRSPFQEEPGTPSTSSLQQITVSSQVSTLRPISFAAPSSIKFPRPMSVVESPSLRTFRAKIAKRKQLRRLSKDESPTTDVEELSIVAILRTVWPLIDWFTRLAVVGGLFCALIHSAATPVFGYVLSQLFTTFYTLDNQQALAQKYALSILGVAAADGLAEYGFNFFFEYAAQKWATALRTESLRRVLLQPREFFDREENSVAHLAECLDQSAEEARNLPGRFFCILLIMVFTVGIALVWALVICWKLVLVAIGCLAVMFLITRVFHAISTRWEKSSNDASNQVGQSLHETFVNIRTVRCLVLEDYFRKKNNKYTDGALAVGIKRAVYTGSIFGLNYASAAFVTSFLMWYGAYLISKGEFTSTDIITTFNVLMLSVAHANHIGFYIPQINVSKDATSRLMRLARLSQDSQELTGTEQLFRAGDIAFNKVNFTYPTRKNHQVLQDVSFVIPKGRCTAIVGTSGSGKSTIAALLLKLYQTGTDLPHNPDISVSKKDIKILHTMTLRSRIAIVSQTPVLFPGTIAENITYGLDPSDSLTSDENIRAAAFAAGCDEFIDSLPNDYRTVVGDGGTGLSGGQAQRIAIARALVRSPDILILDEATSALDVESARLIRKTVKRLVRESRYQVRNREAWPGTMDSRSVGTKRLGARMSQMYQRRGMTVLVITHAREMMSVCEQIIMLDKGRVVEEGTFDDLRRKRGPFSQLLRGDAGNGEFS